MKYSARSKAEISEGEPHHLRPPDTIGGGGRILAASAAASSASSAFSRSALSTDSLTFSFLTYFSCDMRRG